MSRKTLLVLAALACGALVAAGVAVAAKKVGGVQGTSATFDATSVVKSKQTTCTVNGGDTYTYTRAVYSGTSTSTDPRLNGPITIQAFSLVDTSTGAGAVAGRFRINGTDNARTVGGLEAAIADGQANGLVRARGAAPAGGLIASLGSSFTANGGFQSAAIGSGSSNGAGTAFSGGECVRLHHHGLRVRLRFAFAFQF